MNPKLRAMLEANGLRKDATDQEAWEMLDRLEGEGITFPGIDPGQRSAAGAAPATPAPPATPPAGSNDGDQLSRQQAEELARAEVDKEIARRANIEDAVRLAGLTDHDGGNFACSLLDDRTITIDRARAMIFNEMKKRATPVGSGAHGSGWQVGTEAIEKARNAAVDGLAMRCGIRFTDQSPAGPGAREFRGYRLLDVARCILEARGMNVRGLGMRDLAGRALSSSDFAYVLGALVNKTLVRGYMEWPQTWRPIVSVGNAVDFKEKHAIKFSASPDLLPLNELGEYRQANFSDAKESYRVFTKGRKTALTREMMINDDLDAFARIPMLFGAAAKRMEADMVWSLITMNAALADGIALFHADHGNLGTPATLSAPALGLGRAAMRKQKGMAGEIIDIIPAFLLTPVAMETDAEILLRSTALPEANKSAGVYNPWAGKLTPIADPHLDAADPNAWYLVANPMQAPLIEVAWLEGEEQPYVEEQVNFNSDALEIKVRHDFGCGAVDHRGGYMNAGA